MRVIRGSENRTDKVRKMSQNERILEDDCKENYIYNHRKSYEKKYRTLSSIQQALNNCLLFLIARIRIFFVEYSIKFSILKILKNK